ncbi:DUF3237 family protein [Asticcacaulis benevestitus]|uniref:Uncharacterized protein n=1 Tax=Asticcacaulis benevestitus DSM 16100 = ATCC BAA-896 TaxID=1121022 RepID=V4RI78_9CAUL|nr:DUF3237 family protein [Asticcacaulis benevestitus]ESQ91033.1 hypothetical protein ABENE_11315 [Asticcacaulis benevestitus DSM 16100 = ATCC BAA-896]
MEFPKRLALIGLALFGLTGAAKAEPTLAFVFEETVTSAADITPGTTALGERNIMPITGGTFEPPCQRPGRQDSLLQSQLGCSHETLRPARVRSQLSLRLLQRVQCTGKDVHALGSCLYGDEQSQ